MMNLVYLVPLLPLIGFLINGLGRKHLSKSMTGIIGSGVILGSFIISVLLFLQVKAGNTAVVEYFEFIQAKLRRRMWSIWIEPLTKAACVIVNGLGVDKGEVGA